RGQVKAESGGDSFGRQFITGEAGGGDTGDGIGVGRIRRELANAEVKVVRHEDDAVAVYHQVGWLLKLGQDGRASITSETANDQSTLVITGNCGDDAGTIDFADAVVARIGKKDVANSIQRDA